MLAPSLASGSGASVKRNNANLSRLLLTPCGFSHLVPDGWKPVIFPSLKMF